MIRALLWKEYREQRLPALILVVLGVLVLTAVLPIFEDGEPRLDMRLGLALMFAFACGLVTGSILLANERESGTQTLLDILPKWRRQVWMVKLAFGMGMAVVQALVFALVCLPYARGSGELSQAIVAGVAMLLAALFGLFCGLFGSALGRNVLAALGFSMLMLFAVSFIGTLLGGVLQYLLASAELLLEYDNAGFYISGLLLWPLPAVLSLVIYSRVDVSRRLSDRYRPLADRVTKIRGAWGTRSLLWLSARRSRAGLVIFAVIALIAGQCVLIEPLVLWPAITLLIGLIQGTLVFADEQSYGSFRFLAEQRLPLGRVWLTKTTWRFGMAVLQCALMLLGAALFVVFTESLFIGDNKSNFHRIIEERFGFDSYLLENVGYGTFLSLWVVYGFCFGQIAGLLFRKIIVALFLGLGASLLAVSVWIPALVSGGMPAWQMFAIPFGLLILARLVMWAWATDRLMSKRVVIMLAGASAIGVAWIAGTFAWRVRETAPAQPRIVVHEYFASLPKLEDDPVRSLLQRAQADADRHVERSHAWAGPSLPARRRHEVTRGALAVGWRENDADLKSYLELNLRGEWPALLREAARHPVGMLDDPRLLSPSMSRYATYRFVSAAQLLCIDALRQQAEGQHAKALEILLDALTVARHVQNRALFERAAIGFQMEIAACRALALWSQRTDVPPDLLARAHEALGVHENMRPATLDNVRSEYVLTRNRLEHPMVMFSHYAHFRERDNPDQLPWRNSLLVAASLAPWEKNRRDRLLHRTFSLMLDAQEMAYTDILKRATTTLTLQREKAPAERREFEYLNLLPPARDPAGDAERLRTIEQICNDLLLQRAFGYVGNFESTRFLAVTYVRATRIQLALVLYQRRRGKPAEKLEQLVPEFFSAVPIDPYSDRPFHYRLSGGERIRWTTESYAEEESGQWEPEPIAAPGPGMPGMAGDAAVGMPAVGVEERPKPEGVPPERPEPGRSRLRIVPAGAGVLWSATSDAYDDGGAAQSLFPSRHYFSDQRPGQDLIFVVPRIE